MARQLFDTQHNTSRRPRRLFIPGLSCQAAVYRGLALACLTLAMLACSDPVEGRTAAKPVAIPTSTPHPRGAGTPWALPTSLVVQQPGNPATAEPAPGQPSVQTISTQTAAAPSPQKFRSNEMPRTRSLVILAGSLLLAVGLMAYAMLSWLPIITMPHWLYPGPRWLAGVLPVLAVVLAVPLLLYPPLAVLGKVPLIGGTRVYVSRTAGLLAQASASVPTPTPVPESARSTDASMPLWARFPKVDPVGDPFTPFKDYRGTGQPAPITGISMAQGRMHHSANLLPDGRLLVSGGSGPAGLSPVMTAEKLDLITGRWSRAGVMRTPRSGHTVTMLRNGQTLLAVGGSTARGLVQSIELYQAPANAWTAWSRDSSLLHARGSHTATLLRDSRVLVVGGRTASDVLDSSELFDPMTARALETGALHEARYAHTATLLANGEVLVVGGRNASNEPATVERYNPETGQWAVAAPLLTSRVSHTASLLADGRVLVVGGSSNSRDGLAAAELYDPRTDRWAELPSLSVGRADHTATVLSDGRVLVAGGTSGPSTLASSELFDPETNTWSSAGSMVQARFGHTATLLPDGRVLVTGGGVQPTQAVLGTAELYDPRSDTWSLVTRVTRPRS
jgi:hypothetical protein